MAYADNKDVLEVGSVRLGSELNNELAVAARSLQEQSGTQRTLDRSVMLASEIVSGCDHAGLSIVHRDGSINTPAASDDLVRQADRLQYALNEGPGLDAIWAQDTVLSANLVQDARWPRWAPEVASKLGVRSLLCFQLYTTTDTLGALILYSDRVDGFDHDATVAGTFLAAHVAVALAESQNADNLISRALGQALIGQAQGILMERFALGADEAFAVLRRVSQQSNTKLHRIANELIATRQTPGTEPDQTRERAS